MSRRRGGGWLMINRFSLLLFCSWTRAIQERLTCILPWRKCGDPRIRFRKSGVSRQHTRVAAGRHARQRQYGHASVPRGDKIGYVCMYSPLLSSLSTLHLFYVPYPCPISPPMSLFPKLSLLTNLLFFFSFLFLSFF